MTEIQRRVFGLGLALIAFMNMAWNGDALLALRADDGLTSGECVCEGEPPECEEGCACCHYNAATQSTEWKCGICATCPSDPGGPM